MILETANSAVNIDTQVSTCPQDPTIDSTTQMAEVPVRSFDPIQVDVDSIKEEITVDFTAAPYHDEKFHNNKIILGTNPIKSVVNQEQLPLVETKVLLYNIYPYLENSRLYCHRCLILFPNEAAFVSHRESIHTKKCYICGKKFKYNDFQHHLRQVHHIKINTQVKLKKTQNSHKRKACLQKKNSMSIHVKNKSGELARKLQTANVLKDSKERENKNRSMTILLNQQVHETTIRKKIKSKACRTTSNVLESSIELENLINLDSTDVQGTETETSRNYTCFHCEMLFATQKAVIEHLYTTMNVTSSNSELSERKYPDYKSLKIGINNTNEGRADSRHKSVSGHATTTNVEQSINTKTKKTNTLYNSNPSKYQLGTSMYFKCDVCSLYFKSSNLCSSHLLMKHGIIGEEFKEKPFVPNCVFCLEKKADIEDYNNHIIDVHQIKYSEKLPAKQVSESKQETNNESGFLSFVLKSTLFKCTQCDIHFLSANAAQRHAEHMELLINWKCGKCNRIFKKNDEFLHENQHTFSDTFIVHDLSASALTRVLYNCAKCAIHFAEEQFLNHYPICGIDTPIASYCKYCDILIDEGTIKCHRMMHNQKESINFITIDTDIISIKRDGSHILKRKSIEKAETSTKKKKHEMVNNFNLCYCDICNSFLNIQDHGIHIRAQCVKLEKSICKICGLVFTNRSYSLHKDLHCKLGFLKVQDFTFSDVKTKKQICPPVPEYLKCNCCKVIFISEFLLLTHECSEENYLTCHICEDKLSDDAFKLHMSFHYYSITNSLKDDGEGSDSIVKETSSINSPYLQEQRNCNLGPPKLSDVQSKPDFNLLKFPSPLTSFNSGSKTSSTYCNLSKSSKINCNTDGSVSKVPTSFMAKFVQSSCNSTTKIQHKRCNEELIPIIYSCKSCGITVDTYDKVIEHCQSHYEGEGMTVNTEHSYCHECDLKFDKLCYESHKKLHQDKALFKLLNFDTYYFTFDNSTWVKHVFGSMPQSLIDQIVNMSIYRSECRVKMQLVQDGPADLTVFQCDKCQCFIDPSAIYKHAENSCFKLRNHPCSFCGLPFISSNMQIAHEKVHETANITLESYRIVTFNKNEDREFNTFLYNRHNRSLYTLYQCRNCNGAMVKSQIMSHKCDVYSLKKCLECGLLLCGDEFESHILRHNQLSNFIPNNMKVIMFGDKTKDTKGNANTIKSSYFGIICDYLYYRCSKCQVCMKKKDLTTHVCTFGISRTQCSECDLYFVNTKLKSHCKLHNDPDFKPENVKVIPFDPVLHNKFIEQFDSCESDKSDELIFKVAKIYRCTCGLNFLDAASVSTHIKCCNPKIRTSKQKCSKCDLLFTPNVLFSHLLTHHGNKSHKYTFEIIDMTCTKNLIDILYRCPNCKLHFVKGKEAGTHLLNCSGKNPEGKQCNFCNLQFNEVCFNIHVQNHCNTGEFDDKIYEIKICSIPLVKIDEVYNKEKYVK